MKFPAIPTASGRRIVQYDINVATTFRKGAAVVLDAGEEVVECGADPALILGFAAEPAIASPLFGRKDPEVGKVLVCVAEEGRRFWMDGSSAPAANGDDINQSYGIAKDADGDWYVDKTDVVATRVYVHNVDYDRNLYEVSVLEANRQIKS